MVVDRLSVKASSKRRLTDSVETALGLASGLVVFDFVDLPAKDPGRELRFSERMACPNDHPIDTDELEPRSFSFNSPFGACPVCHGLGTRMEVDPELVVSDPGATLGEGAIDPWSGAHVADFFIRLLGALGDELGFDLNTPWEDLPAKARASILDGHPTKVHVRHTNRYGRERSYWTNFEGVRPFIERRHRESESDTTPGALRGLHARGALPRVPGQPSQAGVDGGHDRWQEHRRGLPAADRRDRRVPARPRAVRAREADRRAGAQGDPGAAALPARRRPRLPLARPAVRLALGRRGAAHPARHPDRRRPGRRALRPRRAVDRAAPARQPPAHRDAGPAQGPRQHADRRRARRGHHPRRRLGRRHRARARASTAARSWSPVPSSDLLDHHDSSTGMYLSAPQADPGARGTPPAHAWSRARGPRRARAQPAGHRRDASRSGSSSR